MIVGTDAAGTDDTYGDGANIAARLQEIAETRRHRRFAHHHHVRDKVAVTFTALGQRIRRDGPRKPGWQG